MRRPKTADTVIKIYHGNNGETRLSPRAWSAASPSAGMTTNFTESTSYLERETDVQKLPYHRLAEYHEE